MHRRALAQVIDLQRLDSNLLALHMRVFTKTFVTTHLFVSAHNRFGSLVTVRSQHRKAMLKC